MVGQVGNAWTDADIDNYGAIFYWWSHALISDATFKGISNEVISFLPNCSIVCTFSMLPVTSDMDYVVMEISAALCTVVMEKVWAASEIISKIWTLSWISICRSHLNPVKWYVQCNFSTVGPLRTATDDKCTEYVDDASEQLVKSNLQMNS